MSQSSFGKTVKLTVINDFVCVSCCIAQHELLEAINHCKDTLGLPIQFEVEYVPFRLISTSVLPESSKTDRLEFLAKHMGERFDELQGNVSKWAAEKGIPISLDGTMCQTTKAHRLVLKAARIGREKYQTPLIMAIFGASMQEGRDISDPEVLADLASKVGVMPRDEVLDFLDSNELLKEVEDMSSAARAKGITGVPFIVIDGKWAVSGGQSSDVYIQIFNKLATCQGAHCATTSPLPANMVACV